MNRDLSNYFGAGVPSGAIDNKLHFIIFMENQTIALYLELNSVKAMAYSGNPQIIVYEILAMGNAGTIHGFYGRGITLRLSNYQIFNNIDFSVSLCNNVYNELNNRGKKCANVELGESINDVRIKIQNMITKYCEMPQLENQGYYFANGICYYGIPINSLTRNQLGQDCYSFFNNHDKDKIQNENDIPEILHKVINHFMQLKNKDTRRFLFLYFHMCYMASLFTPLDQSMILVIDSHSRVREDLIKFMFGDCRFNCCEYIS